MFASQTRDLSHIELAQRDNISSSSKARTYRVNQVDISTDEIRARIEGFSPFTLALFLYKGLGLSNLRFITQMRCRVLFIF